MRYLITSSIHPPLLTHWFNEKDFKSDMVVYDIRNRVYTTDGVKWQEIENS